MSELIVGIDLGTTNSLIAFCDKGVPKVIRDASGAAIVPSIVHFDEKIGELTVGSNAKIFKVTDCSHTAFSVKRYMGLGKKDLKEDVGAVKSASDIIDTSLSTDENIVLKLGQRTFSAIEISAEILKKLKSLAENSLKQTVKKAVITVPAYFNDSQRTATKVAGTLAGLEVVRIINEPTAAALAYGLDKKKNGLVAVYDLGGGTFDISILRLHDGIFEVLATGGDTTLGGDDFDRAIYDFLVPQIRPNFNEGDLNNRAKLLDISEKMKIALSSADEVVFDAEFDRAKTRLHLSRRDLSRIGGSLIERTLKIVEQTVKDSGLQKNEINEIVMVGGSTRLLAVQERLKQYFEKNLCLGVNPDEVVALGAAVQADILAGRNQDTVLLDVTPLSLGIETYGGTVGKLIHRNTKIPTMAKETFTTNIEGQRNVLIHVLQGERELAEDCRSLARFDLKGLPPMPAGLPKIEVTFLIDANGILKVRAKELATQVESFVQVKPSYGLTDDQVEQMLSDSFEFAEKDLKARQLIDTRVQAEGVIRAAKKILNEAHELFGSSAKAEIIIIEDLIKKIEDLITRDDYIAIKNGLEVLEEKAKEIAGRVMNQAIQKSLNQKHVNDILKK